MWTSSKQTHNLDQLLIAVLEGRLSLEQALQDAACQKDARIGQLLRDEVAAARLLQSHAAHSEILPSTLRNGRHRLEAQIRSQRKQWQAAFWFSRLDWAVSVALIVILIFTGTAQLVGQTRHALAITLPGDFLYFLKNATEQVRLDLASSPEDRIRLHLEFARNRALEFESLIIEEQYGLLPQTLAGLESALARAQLLVDQNPNELPDDLKARMAQIEQMLDRQIAMLEYINAPVPANLRTDIERIAWVAFEH